MDKNQLTETLKNWLKNFLEKKMSSTHEILEVLIPGSSLSKINNTYIKQMPNYSSWEFKPDILAILKEKVSGKMEFIFLNRSLSALSLKEIGEIYSYSKLANSRLSFLVSLNGVSNEVAILLLEDDVRKRLLNYGDGSEIIIFSLDEKNNAINSNSVIPLDKKNFLLG